MPIILNFLKKNRSTNPFTESLEERNTDTNAVCAFLIII